MRSAAEIVFERLQGRSSRAQALSHSELMQAAGLPAVRCGTRRAYIHARLSERSPGLPCLVAIAVPKTTGMPSGGLYRNEGFELDLKKPSHRVRWRAMVLLVFATDRSDVKL